MKTRILAVSLAAILSMAAATAFAADPPNFDFNGYSIIPPAVTGALVLRSVLTNNDVVPTPIPLSFATQQHTLVVTAILSAAGSPQSYSSVAVELWSDTLGGGGYTAANYAVPGTFVDGDLILSGVMPAGLLRYTFSATLGSYIGKVNWTGGSRLGELIVKTGWPFGGGWSRRSGLGIPPGYDENWDGKIDYNSVGVEEQNWDRIKGLYR